MSLLMDALKKAEREKNKANLKKDPDNTSETKSQLENTSTSLDESQSELTSEATSSQSSDVQTSPEKDDSWAFDSSELELEPIAIPEDETNEDDQESTYDLDDDTTLIEPMPLQKDSVAGLGSDDLTVLSETDPHKSDFDHDATLPSERAIQSSLKDYFDVSQSITMDQSRVNAAIAPDVTEHSITSTSPLDTSATHVTAHTIFTAGQGRHASTGLTKYAIFGTIALALGLGAVAVYYTYTTPSATTMPTQLPTVATMVDSDKLPQTVEVDRTEPPFEPGVKLTVTELEPSIAQKEESTSNIPESESVQTEEAVKNTVESSVVEQEIVDLNVEKSEELVVASPVLKPAGVAKEFPEETFPEELPKFETPTYDIRSHEVVTFSSTGEPSTQAQSVTEVSEPSFTYENNTNVSGQSYESEPVIEVMSSKDFSEGLTVPKSAIRITKVRSHRASSSDLSLAYNAYQAGDYVSAKSIYRKVLSNRPDSRDARLGLAAVSVLERNYETAYSHYQYLLQQNPQDQVVKAALFNLQGNASGAVNESQLKLSLDKNPDSPQVHFSLGSFYAGQGRWPEAQQAFFDAYTADQKNADYAYNLAVSLDQMGQAKTALSYYRKALKLADQSSVSFNTPKVLARIQKLSGIVKP